ncbi:MAG: LysM peptidoglycan-binding domain-containing protein [Patescibacteria group bacterium]|nr:LysM peptidoglycan-binding domain-containing protein [Patescibacteria group bacterium]
MDKKQTNKILKRIKINESTISMVLGVAVLLVTAGLIINYFKNINKETIGDEAAQINQEQVTEFPSEPNLDNLPVKYEVQTNDNLWKIAEKFYGSGYNWVDIVKENSIQNPDILNTGTVLVIPQAEVIMPETITQTVFGKTIDESSYTVEKGDHLWGIAVRAYGDGFRWPEIAVENNIENPDAIEIGMVLSLPR